MLPADLLLAAFEVGSAGFGLFTNIPAIRRDKVVRGVSWVQTAFYTGWGFANLYIYAAAGLPLAWWGGMGITLVNIAWLAHVFHYAAQARGLTYGQYILGGINSCLASLKRNCLSLRSLVRSWPTTPSSLRLP